MKVYEIETKDWYEIAKIIDNEFMNSRDTFSSKLVNGAVILNTNKIDNCSVVRVNHDSNHEVSSIEVSAPYTDGWVKISKVKLETVLNYIEDLKNKTNE